MRAGRAGDRDQQSQRRRTRGRAGCAVAHTDCPVGTRPGQYGRCRPAPVGPAAAGEATWATSGQESHPTQWPLTRLPISPTASDRLLTVDVASDNKARAIVWAVAEIAQALDLELVAEGVETEAQALWLARSGCRILQGYLFGRPMPADSFGVTAHERGITATSFV